MMVTVRLGYGCANAGAATATRPNTANAAVTTRFMGILSITMFFFWKAIPHRARVTINRREWLPAAFTGHSPKDRNRYGCYRTRFVRFRKLTREQFQRL